MTHSEYIAYFRTIAEKHPSIRHTVDKMHFARIVLTVDELGQSNISEFISSLRSQMETPFLLIAAPDANYEDNQSDNVKKFTQGMCWLLDKVDDGDFEGEESVYDSLEVIAEQILAKMRYDFSNMLNNRFYSLNQSRIEKIGQVDDFLGVRLDFQLFTTANIIINHNPANWLP